MNKENCGEIHEAKIIIKVNPDTGEANFKFYFSPEIKTKKPDSNRAAQIAFRMFHLLDKDLEVQ